MQDKQIGPPVFVQIGRAVCGAAGAHQLNDVAAGIGVGAQRLQNVGGQLTRDEDLNAGAAGQRGVFHAGEARAVALYDVHRLIVAVDHGEDVCLERLIPRGFQKRDRLFLSVTVQIGQLYGLLIDAGDRRGIDGALRAHDRLNGLLQPVIIVGVLRQRVQLVDRFHKAARQQQHKQRRQSGQKQPFCTQRRTLLLQLI